MALVECRECKEQVSSQAPTCPKCGVKNPAAKKTSIIGAIVGAFILFIIIASIVNGSSGNQTGTSAPPIEQERQPNIGSKETIAIESAGCSDVEIYDRLFNYIMQKDDEAFRKEVMQGLMNGKCIMLKVGDVVYISDVSVFHGRTLVRPVGATQEYWVFTKAVTGK